MCDNQQYGCTVVINLDRLESHLKECEHNPKRPVQCEQGCGMVVPMDEVKVRPERAAPSSDRAAGAGGGVSDGLGCELEVMGPDTILLLHKSTSYF